MGDLNCGCGIPDRCGNNSGGCSSIIWIIILLFLCNGNDGGGCNSGCNSGLGLSNIFGGGNDGCGCIIIILLLLCCCGGGNSIF